MLFHNRCGVQLGQWIREWREIGVTETTVVDIMAQTGNQESFNLWERQDGYKYIYIYMHIYIDGLVQERHNPSVLAIELRLSCTNPSISYILYIFHIYLYQYLYDHIDQTRQCIPVIKYNKCWDLTKKSLFCVKVYCCKQDFFEISIAQWGSDILAFSNLRRQAEKSRRTCIILYLPHVTAVSISYIWLSRVWQPMREKGTYVMPSPIGYDLAQP